MVKTVDQLVGGVRTVITSRQVGVAFLAACVAMVGMSACSCSRKNKTNIDRNMVYEMSDTSSQRGQQFDYDKECKLNEILDAPKKDTPEHTLHQLFVHWKKAVDTGWKGSRDDLADSWRELFITGDNYLREINNSLINLTRKKKKIDQYLISGKKGVAVKLCQRRFSDEKVKFFIWKNSKDSNPPVDVVKDPEDGTWKLSLSFRL